MALITIVTVMGFINQLITGGPHIVGFVWSVISYFNGKSTMTGESIV